MSDKIKALRAELHGKLHGLPYLYGPATNIFLASYSHTDGLARRIASPDLRKQLSEQEWRWLAEWIAALHREERGRPFGNSQQWFHQVLVAVEQARQQWCKENGRQRCPRKTLDEIIVRQIYNSGIAVRPQRVRAMLKEKRSRR